MTDVMGALYHGKVKYTRNIRLMLYTPALRKFKTVLVISTKTILKISKMNKNMVASFLYFDIRKEP